MVFGDKKMWENKGKHLLTALIAIVVVGVVMASGCIDFGGQKEVKTVVVTGSSTVLPIASLCAEAFNAKQDAVRVTVSGGGSGHGVKSVATGEADIGMASREVKQNEITEFGDNFVDHIVAYDAVVMIVSKQIYDSGVTNLTIEQVRGIYNGMITNWNEVGGPDKNIYVVARKTGSGTYHTFMEFVFGSDTSEAPGTDTECGENAEVKTAVAGSDKAIGYVGLGYVSSSTPGMALNGVSASADTVKNGDYPISRSLHMYTWGEPNKPTQEFLDFVLGPEGQQIVEDEGFILL